MIFRRRQDEMEGFRRMREALRQQADPQDHALLDDQYEEGLDDDEELSDEELDELEDEADDEETEADEADEAAAVANAEASAAPPLAANLAPAATSPAFIQPSAAARSAMTTIGADATWSGTLRSESDVYLEGRVDGTLEVRQTLYIADRATVEARIKANAVVVSGTLSGHIECEGRLEVTPTGRLSGEVVAGVLVIHEGAVVDGKFQMRAAQAGSSPSANA